MEESSKPEPPPAQEANTEGSTWWSSWLNSAKEKSVSALNATKRDLAEFVSVLGTDTKAAVSGAGENIKGMIIESKDAEKKDILSTKPKAPPPVIEAPTAPYDRSQAQLFAVQNSTDTYLIDPKGDKYNAWKSTFSVQSHQSDISGLLVSCPHIRTLHSQLVPAKVSYEMFWMRYFYKVQLLEQEEKLRAELMARASKPSEQQLQWDEEFEEVGVESLKPEGAGHQRSESSSDSFVCVSESATNDGERAVSQDRETWEVVGGGSQESPPSHKSPASQAAQNKNKEDFDIDDLLEEDVPDSAEPNQTDKTLEDSNSDWENWDD